MLDLQPVSTPDRTRMFTLRNGPALWRQSYVTISRDLMDYALQDIIDERKVRSHISVQLSIH